MSRRKVRAFAGLFNRTPAVSNIWAARTSSEAKPSERYPVIVLRTSARACLAAVSISATSSAARVGWLASRRPANSLLSTISERDDRDIVHIASNTLSFRGLRQLFDLILRHAQFSVCATLLLPS